MLAKPTATANELGLLRVSTPADCEPAGPGPQAALPILGAMVSHSVSDLGSPAARAQAGAVNAVRLKSLVLVLAMLPLLLALAAVVWVVGAQLQALANTQKESVAAILNQARHDELARLVGASLRAIVDRFPDSAANPLARQQALAYLRSLNVDDSYFFVYDVHGKCLLDGGDPSINNLSCIDLRDDQGVLVVQRLIGQALGGGGFLEHNWTRPSTGKTERKLSYARLLPQWNWVVGTGLYHDSLRQADLAITQSSDDAVEITRTRIVGIATLALLAVGIGGLLLTVQEQRKADAKLRRMHQKAERAAQETREVVARDLHDGVQASILACRLTVESATVLIENGTGDGLKQLHGVVEDLNAVGSEVRALSKDLASLTLRDVGLRAALEEAAHKLADRGGVELVLNIDETPPMPLEVARDLLLFARQAIHNALMHAEASRIELRLRFDVRSGLALEVCDNGKGFDHATVMRGPRAGLGLTSMRERIEMLGGSFNIRSTPGIGPTVVLALVPPQALRALCKD